MQTAAQSAEASPARERRIAWADIYRESELIKAALRVYTKPLFAWRKALSASSDGRSLYDFARYGLRNLESIHRALVHRTFHFRPGLALTYNFNGKRRTLYVYPWEERIVDLLLYRLLGKRLDRYFSPHSFAYRPSGYGVDRCQRQIAQALTVAEGPRYVIKRDIANYFPSIAHDLLEAQLERWIERGDYLWDLVAERIHFRYMDSGSEVTAAQGIPFGTSIACLFANVYLAGVDEAVTSVPRVHYFRYADDFLLFSSDRNAAAEAVRRLDEGLARLRLQSKPSHEQDLLFCAEKLDDDRFVWTPKFRHLGLEFRAGGPTGLSRDKFRKICNLFRFEFRRGRAKLARIKDSQKRLRLALELARRTIDRGVRNIAIIDYYLKHVEDEEQLQRLDRWLAEEVLSIAFGGHRRGHFKRVGFDQLRAMGLPSLVHRRRLLRHGRLVSPFFIWTRYQETKSSRGSAARLRRLQGLSGAAFSPHPEAAVEKAS
ncbi:MAG TPA: reverse transcriptase domain-containing protein [Candidatus Acidoferrales bacterium]|nr:reverse transcriptase domain-containing protein [Candidatus Acidoferrales bacterium]